MKSSFIIPIVCRKYGFIFVLSKYMEVTRISKFVSTAAECINKIIRMNFW